MIGAMHIVYWVAGVIVFAESLNKLERTDPFCSGMRARWHVVVWLKALAWMLLAAGGFLAMVSPLLTDGSPSVQDLCIVLGFAVLIVRTRVKEG